MFFYGQISRLIFSILLVFSPVLHAADYSIDDDYLQNLSEEADKLEYMDKAEQEARQSAQHEASSSPAVLATTQRAVNSLRDFERVLLTEYPSSYQLYRNLGITQKNRVFEIMQRSRKLSLAQHKIIELYKQTLTTK